MPASLVPAEAGESTPAVTLDDLKLELRGQLLACRSSWADAVDHAREAGMVLIEIKKLLPHGSFTNWITAHTELSPRSCQGYMQLARSNARALAGLTLEDALRQIAQPREGGGDADVPRPEPFAVRADHPAHRRDDLDRPAGMHPGPHGSRTNGGPPPHDPERVCPTCGQKMPRGAAM